MTMTPTTSIYGLAECVWAHDISGEELPVSDGRAERFASYRRA